VVGEVVEGSPAATAGLRSGDRIDAIDGRAITRFEQIQALVTTHAGQKLTLQVTRNGLSQLMDATPESRGTGPNAVGVLGIKGGTVAYETLSPPMAVVDGVAQTWTVAAQTLQGVWQMLSGQRGTDDLGGPLRIAQLSGQVAQLGFASLVSFIAVLSVNLGLINLFPIPVLDGGHLVFFALEALRGKPLPPRAVEYGFRAGFALLIGLFVFATWNDLTHLGLFRWVSTLIG
jgi:regulator of sigma E protease